ncbi:unnamed protein product [Closterium sp. NIES-53]
MRDSVSLFDHTYGAAPAPPAIADSATRSLWLTRDAAARLAIRNHLLLAECTHFGQYRTAQALYNAVVARYISPSTAALGRLLLPYLFPEQSAFAIVEDLVSHLRTSDAHYRTAALAEFLARNQPPMFITLYIIVTRLPDSIRSVRDHLLSLDPTVLTIDLLEQHLLADETSVVAVGAARGTPRTPFFEGCSPSPRAPSYASAAVVDVPSAEDVGAASASAKRRSSKGKGGRGNGGGSGGGGGGSSGGGGSGGSGGWIGGFGGGNGGSGGSGSSGSGGSGGGRTGAQRGEGDCYLCVPPDLGIEAAALGASESSLPGTAPAEALHTFTLNSGASRWSSLYTLATEPPQVAASAQVSASGQVAPPCSCRLLSHQTLLWHHRLGHPSLPRLRGMHSRLLVSGLPRSLPPLPPSPALPYLPCVEGRQRTAPHSSLFPPTTNPLQTLHMVVWGPARISGQGRERYFLLVVDDYTRYTMVFPLRSKDGHNEIDERRIGLVMELNLWPRVSLPETSPTLRWTGKVGDASVLRVVGNRSFVCDTSAVKLSARAIPCVFLVFPLDAPGWHFYHPTSRRVLPSLNVTFDESVPFYRLFPYPFAPPLPPPLFLAPSPPPVDPLPPQGPAPSGVSHVDPLPGAELACVGPGVAM